MRLPKQVLVIPFKKDIDGTLKYCIFKRNDLNVHQFIAGGMEDFDETIESAVKREFFEETGIDAEENNFFKLEEECMIPVVNIVKDFLWGENVFYAKEYAFGVCLDDKYKINLSSEHKDFAWLTYDEARKLLKYDSNKSALWELDTKIKKNIIKS